LPFKIVFGIEDALLPAAVAGKEVMTEKKITIVARVDKWLRFTGDLRVFGM
jgi:hypothetical protein